MSKLSRPDEAAQYVAQVAAHRGWVVNPDSRFTAGIVEGLAAQNQRWGRPFCPCRDVDGPEDHDIVCPCAYAQADIDEHGQCYCGLFLALGMDPKKVASIPERRS